VRDVSTAGRLVVCWLGQCPDMPIQGQFTALLTVVACQRYNPEHVLHQFLTEREQTYNLRRRPHGSKTLLTKTHAKNHVTRE